MDGELALRLVAVAALILANAFFVIAEYALVTVRRSAIQQRAAQGSARARRVLRLMDDPVRVLSTVQVAITALGILLGAIGEPALRPVFDPVLSAGVAIGLSLALVTFLSVWLGELVPKALALHSGERIALLVATPIDFCSRLFRPVVWLLQVAAGLVLRPLGVPSVSAGERPVTREELRSVLEEAEEHGTLGAEEERMLSGVIDLRAQEVREILTPWDDVAVVDADAPVTEAAERVKDAPYTRYPVLDPDGRHVVGMLHVRDVWRALTDNPEARVRDVMRQPVIVPPNARVPRVLRAMRHASQHLAVVMNEYGQMVGVVSLEDVIEEVVGEIEDELDRPSDAVRSVGTQTWEVDAGIAVEELNRLAELDLPTERDHTVAGLVFSELGRAPHRGDEVRVGAVGLRVDEVDGHRIEKITARLDGADQ